MAAVAFCIFSLKWWQDPGESEKEGTDRDTGSSCALHGSLLLLSFENKTPVCQVRSLLHKLLGKW